MVVWLLLGVSALTVGVIYGRHLRIIAIHSVETWNASRSICLALKGAKSVALVEFDGRDETKRVVVGPIEVAELLRATPRWLMPSGPEGHLCFDPHHRVDIVRADGSQLHFVVCFSCRNFELDSPRTGIVGLPDSWRKSLTALFSSVGMKPFGAEDYDDDKRREK